MEKYQRLKEDFRHHYFTRYGVKLDDEILIIFIRINEMHRDLKKDIRRTPPIHFKIMVIILIILLLAILMLLVFKY